MDGHQEDERSPGHDKKSQNEVLLNTFLISNKKHRVLLHHDNLTWERESSRNGKTTVPLIDILAVRLCGSNRNDKRNISGSRISISQSITSSPASTAPISAEAVDSSKNYLHVYYAKRESDCHRDHNKWRKHTLKLSNSDYRIIQKWYDTLFSSLENQKRPKNILMFINPYGGRRQALKIYEKYSKPLFQLAGVEVSCLISQRGNQIHDILLNNPALDQYDAICCVGGDGTFAEVFNGLMRRTLKDLNLDPQRPKYLPKLKVPIGLIPGGSTNTVAYSLHGTTDVITAVIHIILGQTGGLDLSSVCNHLGLVRLYASAVGYGYLGDLTLDSEQYRWMGPKRYVFSGLKKFVANRGYEVELTFSVAEDESSTSKNDEKTFLACTIGCPRCSRFVDKPKSSHYIDYTMLESMFGNIHTIPTASNNSDSQPHELSQLEKETENWRTIRGKYFLIAGANIACASSRSPNGLAPFCHLGDGHIDIIVIRHTHVFNVVRLMLRLNRENPKIEMLPFVDVYRTKKFLVRSLKSSAGIASTSDLSVVGGSRQPISSTNKPSEDRNSQWNCDGEIVFDTDVLISSHRQLVDVFMRGPYPSSENGKSACCGLCRN